MTKHKWETVSAEENPAAAEIKELMLAMQDDYDINDFITVLAMFNLSVQALRGHDCSEEEILEFVKELCAAKQRRDASTGEVN